ncbi:MAG TPA: 3-isopropylmalate dehydratase small subunit [Firmicutes bacterium]|nr:3-isopropylmalate dehydratase small subunit [Bacillota bacterium]
MIKGRVWKFGDDIDTDVIIPARYLNTSDPAELAKHCMEDKDPDFVKKVSPGDIIVGGANFGCGSSREHAPVAIKASGVACVIARSFARIFFRNAINIGLPVFESEEASEKIREGDTVEVDQAAGTIKNLTTGEIYSFHAFPRFMEEIIKAGGLIPYTRRRLEQLGAATEAPGGIVPPGHGTAMPAAADAKGGDRLAK